MRHEIVLAPNAVEAFNSLSARWRAIVRDTLEKHLRHEPTKVSKSRIKRLRGLSHPQYRLRIDDIRVFYDVKKNQNQILAIVPKAKAGVWLEVEGTPESRARQG